MLHAISKCKTHLVPQVGFCKVQSDMRWKQRSRDGTSGVPALPCSLLDSTCGVLPTQKGSEKDFGSLTVMWLMAAVPPGSLNKVWIKDWWWCPPLSYLPNPWGHYTHCQVIFPSLQGRSSTHWKHTKCSPAQLKRCYCSLIVVQHIDCSPSTEHFQNVERWLRKSHWVERSKERAGAAGWLPFSALCFFIFSFCSLLESFYLCSRFHGNCISCLSPPALNFLFDFPSSQDKTFFSFWTKKIK